MAAPGVLFNSRMTELKKLIDYQRNMWGSTEIELVNGAAIFARSAKTTLENEGYKIRYVNDRTFLVFPTENNDDYESVFSGLGVLSPKDAKVTEKLTLLNIHYEDGCECSKCDYKPDVKYNPKNPIGWVSNDEIKS
jgi:hypothetical protein